MNEFKIKALSFEKAKIWPKGQICNHYGRQLTSVLASPRIAHVVSPKEVEFKVFSCREKCSKGLNSPKVLTKMTQDVLNREKEVLAEKEGDNA